MKASIWIASAAVILGNVAGCSDESTQDDGFFAQTELISDRSGDAFHTDAALVNPWGLAYGPDTAFWIANNGSATATVCDADGVSLLPTITADANPTGLVYNTDEAGFGILADGEVLESEFLFATDDGRLLAWSPELDPGLAVTVVDNSSSGAVYTGLAMSPYGDETYLYAADFAGGKVDVFESDFQLDTDLGADAFIDPDLPAGYSPFGVSQVDGMIYVAYALQDEEDPEEEVAGAGNGIVSEFEADGEFVARVETTGGALDAPWQVVRAPESFGAFGGALLVGNLGDGHITAFDRTSHEMLGQLDDRNGDAIAIEGLWGMTFGNDADAGDSDVLYFTAGIDDETHGLFGNLVSVRTIAGGGSSSGGGSSY